MVGTVIFRNPSKFRLYTLQQFGNCLWPSSPWDWPECCSPPMHPFRFLPALSSPGALLLTLTSSMLFLLPLHNQYSAAIPRGSLIVKALSNVPFQDAPTHFGTCWYFPVVSKATSSHVLHMEDKTLKKKRVEMPQTSIAEEYGALESVGVPTKPSRLMGLSFPSGNTWI